MIGNAMWGAIPRPRRVPHGPADVGRGRRGRRTARGERPRLPELLVRALAAPLASGVVAAGLATAAPLVPDAAPSAEAADAMEAAGREASRRELVGESMDQLLPLAPEEIRDYVRRRDAAEGAAEPDPAHMRTQARTLRSTPGAAPQVVRLTSGYASTLIFQDVTGAPWPVLSVVLGNGRAFAASQPGVERTGQGAGGSDANGHADIVNVVPLTNHASSNLVLTLEDAPYPVVLHLVTESAAREGRVSDALVVFRLDRPGPNARRPAVGPPSSGLVSDAVLGLVHGIPPQGACEIRLEPRLPGTRLWEYAGGLYLRTCHQPVWPAWKSVTRGEAASVYVLPRAPSVVVSMDGRRVTARVGRRGRPVGEAADASGGGEGAPR